LILRAAILLATALLPLRADSLSSQLDAIFSKLSGPKSPGLAVLVKRGGEILFERGYGARDLQSAAAIDRQTNFRLASFTKQFTAMSVMLLVHDGKLRYDTSLAEIFREFPTYGRAITIRHLLTHTSGLRDYEDLMGDRWTPEHQIQDREVLDLLEHQTAGKFAPGTKWEYSNSGYVVLGLIVAKVSGVPFPQFLHDRIFARLHMSNTLAYVKGQNVVPNRTYGHPNDQSSTSATLGDGGVYSNLVDLSKWECPHAPHASERVRNGARTRTREGTGFTPIRLRLVSRSIPRPRTLVAYRQHQRIPHRDRTLPRRRGNDRYPLQPSRPGARQAGTSGGRHRAREATPLSPANPLRGVG
jgi:CubicO group peptidase (beta-lactamase class C family)